MEDIKVTVVSKKRPREQFNSDEQRDIELKDLYNSKENTSGEKKFQT